MSWSTLVFVVFCIFSVGLLLGAVFVVNFGIVLELFVVVVVIGH